MRKISLILLLLIVSMAIFADYISPYDFYETNLDNLLAPPSWYHLFGTDALGRDVFSRTIKGLQISLIAAFSIIVFGNFVGLVIGCIIGYFNNWLNFIFNMFNNFALSFPQIVLSIIILTLIGPGTVNCIIVVSLIWFPISTRYFQNLIFQEKQKEYVNAAITVGCGKLKILTKHIFPNIKVNLIKYLLVDFPNALIFFAGLSFIGLGTFPPTPELGQMIFEGKDYIQQWWLTVFPGIFLCLIVFSLNIISKELRG